MKRKTNNFKSLVVRYTIIVMLYGMSMAICAKESSEVLEKEAPLSLKDLSNLFKKDVLIVIGENSTQIEKESADLIKNDLKKRTGNEPLIKADTEVSKNDKLNYNLILIGTPDSKNLLIKDVDGATTATKVTKEYPGKNKGVIEIIRNSWNKERALLIIAGSDMWGAKAGSEMIKYINELDKADVVIDWEHLVENKQALVLGLTPNQFKILKKGIYEYLYKKYPFLRNTEFGVRYEKVNTKDKGIPPGHMLIDAYANFRTPPVVVRSVFFDSDVKIISEKINKEVP